MRRICRIVERRRETPSTVTLRFDDPIAARPGQFVMIWLPGDDELPMSLSYVGDRKGVTIKRMGSTSGHFLELPPEAPVGIRGPYGNSFEPGPERLLVVGGGSGTAVLAPAAEAAAAGGARVTAALGATTAEELLFADRLRGSTEVRLATDDGTLGHRGYVTELAERLLDDGGFDAVWTCGPEIMMRKVADAAARASVPVYCSIERHMKCALGLCDACAVGPYHVCTDGPVFRADRLLALPEFGRWHRDASGRRVGPGA